MGTPCVGGSCINSAQRTLPQTVYETTTFQMEFWCPGPGIYFFAVDQQSPGTYINFDVSVACFTSGITLDMENNCSSDPVLQPLNQGYYTTWNGVIAPWTYDGSTGGTFEVCEHVYIKNTTNWEYLIDYSMQVGECWTNIRNLWPDNGNHRWYANDPPVGCVNNRGWDGTISGNTIDWHFTYPFNSRWKSGPTWYCGWNSTWANTSPPWGDGLNLGGPFSCAYYRFCYTADIDPTCYEAYGLQNIITLTDDGVGGATGTSPSTIIFTYDWSYNSFNPLPVQLLDFEGRCSGNDVAIQWTTASETNNDFFTLEMSMNGLNFEPIAQIPGAGNSNDINRYTFMDKTYPYPVYYKLTQTDFDGTSNSTKVISVNCTGNQNFNMTVADNSLDGTIDVSFNSVVDVDYLLTVIDANGKIVFSKLIKSDSDLTNISINTVSFAQGIYFVKVVSNVNSHSQKIMIK
jgi:hypothetical protein